MPKKKQELSIKQSKCWALWKWCSIKNTKNIHRDHLKSLFQNGWTSILEENGIKRTGNWVINKYPRLIIFDNNIYNEQKWNDFEWETKVRVRKYISKIE